MTRTSRTWVAAVGAAVLVAALLLGTWWLAQPAPATRSAEPGTAGAVGGGAVGGGSAGGGSSGSDGTTGAVVGDPGGTDPGATDPGAGGTSYGQPPIGRDPVLVEGGVRVDSYVVRGQRLLLNYTTGVPECYGEVALASVQETAYDVTVSLRSVPPTDPAAQCIDLAITGTLGVDLARPLAGRDVRDGSYEPLVLVARVDRPYARPTTGATEG